MDGVWQIFVALAAAMAMCPFAFFWGCLPCCQGGCEVADGKPRTDPNNEGTWVPSGTWRGAGGVTWTFNANPGDDSGETWFFYGSVTTSSTAFFASTEEQEDWANICNWYSNKTTSPSTTSGLPAAFNKRATRLPPANAVVHIYSNVSTNNSGPVTVKNAYFWGSGNGLTDSSELTATSAAFDSPNGVVFNNSSQNAGGSTINGGATFNDSALNTGASTINGGALFNDLSQNTSSSTVNDGATFNDSTENNGSSTVNDSAQFNDSARNFGSGTVVNGGADFYGTALNQVLAVVNDGAEFFDSSKNWDEAVVNGGAVFNDTSQNFVFGSVGGTVNGGAVFNDDSQNLYIINGGAVFNNNSINRFAGVNGGATFNDAACSESSIGDFFASPCTRKFVAHPTDLPTCNGTAPDGCANASDTCGCG